ncbi:toxic anion resistance protein, partial [Methanobrevibacter sp.]
MAEFSLDIDGIKEDVEKSINVEKEKLEDSNLKTQAGDNAQAIFDADLNNPQEREGILKPLDNFGLNEMSRSASHNEMLATRFVDLTKGGKDADNIGDQLIELNKQMKDLDPSRVDFTKKGVIGNLMNPVRKYFAKYEKAEGAISDIVESLDKSSKVLQNDNTTLLNEETYLREVTNKLLADIELGKQMDASIEAQIQSAEIEGVEQSKIDFVREEILFPLRQRIMDMQQMIVVNQQGIVSLNVIRRNNKELIRGVNRAKTVTVSALRTGVMVASALYDQKIVMDKITILNQTTENIIETT